MANSPPNTKETAIPACPARVYFCLLSCLSFPNLICLSSSIFRFSAIMFSNLATKIALKKVGLSSKDLDFSAQTQDSGKLSKNGGIEEDASSSGSWLSYKSLPLTVHPWFSPPPPPVKLGRVPQVGEVAPLDRDRKLAIGGGQKVMVVFLRCVGCACTFSLPV